MIDQEIRGAITAQVAAMMPDHQTWCHAQAHGECCAADDCDCGVAEALERLVPYFAANMRRYAALHLRDAADGLTDRVRTWVLDDLRDRADELDRLAGEALA